MNKPDLTLHQDGSEMFKMFIVQIFTMATIQHEITLTQESPAHFGDKKNRI